MENRLFKFEGVRNFRDFGGYHTEDGRMVKRGLLFRSGHYDDATAEDVAAVDQLKIAFQADLRRPDERDRQPGKWSAPDVLTSDGGREMRSPHVTFLSQVEADASKAEDWMNDYYVTAPYKEHHKELFSGWFDRLAGLDDSAPALVNCAAGKDRTGILCALTKHALGVSRTDIMADYELTNTAVNVDAHLPAAKKRFDEFLGKSYDMDVYRPFMGVRRRYLETAFDAIERESGSVDAYLERELGMTEAMRAALKSRLLAS